MTSSDSHSTGSEFLNVLAEKAEKMTEQAFTAMNRSQQAVIEAVSNWALTTQAMMPQPPTSEGLEAMPNPTELVARSFDVAEQLLAAQRSFATKLMESVQGPLAEAATKASSAAQDLSAAASTSTRTAADGASDASQSVTQTVKEAFAKD